MARPSTPDRYHRDDFVCLPYQLDAGRLAVGYYVMTRDVTHAWDADRDVFDPARYVMPDQDFELDAGQCPRHHVGVGSADRPQVPGDGAGLRGGPADPCGCRAATRRASCSSTRSRPGPQIEESRSTASRREGAGEKPARPWRLLPPSPGASCPTAPVPVSEYWKAASARVRDHGSAGSGCVTVEHEGLRTTWPHWA
ncbi:MAG: hypothetical protein U0736_02560 [Gemmataceae bacterium]